MNLEKEIYNLSSEISLQKQRLKLVHDQTKLYRKLSNKANVLAASEMNRRLTGMNNLKSQLDQQANTFVNYDKLNTLEKSLEAVYAQTVAKVELRIDTNTKDIAELKSINANTEGRRYSDKAIWALVIIIISALLNYFIRAVVKY